MLNLLKKIILFYFLSVSFAIHLSIVYVYIFNKSTFYQIREKVEYKLLSELNPNYYNEKQKNYIKQLDKDIKLAFDQWKSKNADVFFEQGKVKVGNIIYSSLKEAGKHLKDGQTMLIGAGIYHEGIAIKANNVIVRGQGRVILDGKTVEGKAAIVTKGKNISIENLECRNISVPDQNGACIRSEGKSLFLKNVYFHDSEQGLISGNKTQLIHIKDSRFEKLGKNGQAHGVYIGSGKLLIENSLFIAAVSEGHEIKSRGFSTIIKNSVIASMSAKDSRLIDIPSGGELLIENSILQQGKNSVNSDAIGFGLEKIRHKNNKIKIQNSIIILERKGHNNFLHIGKVKPVLQVNKNIIVTNDSINFSGFNNIVKNRSEVGIKPYPYLPLPE